LVEKGCKGRYLQLIFKSDLKYYFDVLWKENMCLCLFFLFFFLSFCYDTKGPI